MRRTSRIIRYALAAALGGVLAWMSWTQWRGAAWQPTSWERIRRMLDAADVQPGEIVFDLGSGDGRVLEVAVTEYEAQGVGIEVDPARAAWSRRRLSRAGLADETAVIRGDFFWQDLSDADVVFLFLQQHTNDQLADKLHRELHPGARIVSNGYTLEGFEPLYSDAARGVYAYRVTRSNS